MAREPSLFHVSKTLGIWMEKTSNLSPAKTQTRLFHPLVPMEDRIQWRRFTTLQVSSVMSQVWKTRSRFGACCHGLTGDVSPAWLLQRCSSAGNESSAPEHSLRYSTASKCCWVSSAKSSSLGMTELQLRPLFSPFIFLVVSYHSRAH